MVLIMSCQIADELISSFAYCRIHISALAREAGDSDESQDTEGAAKLISGAPQARATCKACNNDPQRTMQTQNIKTVQTRLNG